MSIGRLKREKQEVVLSKDKITGVQAWVSVRDVCCGYSIYLLSCVY